MYGKLAAVGLVKQRNSQRLAAFIDGWVIDRSDVKPATAVVFGHTHRNLVEFFGAEKALRDITRGDADQLRSFLNNQKLAGPTMRRRCGIAKQIFRAAVRRKLILFNPFEDLPHQVKPIPHDHSSSPKR